MARICTARSLAESFALFKAGGSAINNCKFVLAAQSGATPGFAVNRTFSAGGAVRSLFNTERVLVLDKKTVLEMEAGAVTFPIDYSISLDTQALSYLAPHLDGRTSGIPADFKEVFDFMARDDVFVDPIPYLHENLRNLDDQESAGKIFEKLKAYEVLRTLGTDWLRVHGEARSQLSKPEIEKRAQELVATMYIRRSDECFMQTLTFRQQFMYSHLLLMAIVQLGTPRTPAQDKMWRFAERCDSTLATLSGRETAIARAYFEQGQRLTFFGKLQAKKPDLFDILNGMAWDLWHVRQMEELMTLKPSREARYFFPALLTFDKRLIEIMGLYPLKACAHIEGDHEPIPFYDGDWFGVVAGEGTLQRNFAERFYSDEARVSRDERRTGIKSQMPRIVADLEAELSAIASITRPAK